MSWATERGLSVDRVVAEVGCGMNVHRRTLIRVVSDPAVTVLVVEHRDLLTRFGSSTWPPAAGGRGARRRRDR